MTPALVSPTRNSRSRAQTSIFPIENQHFLLQIAPEASWPPDVSAESLEARSPQPGVLSQSVFSPDSSARSPQPGFLGQESPNQESSARSPQQRFLSQDSSAGSLQSICLGSALESSNVKRTNRLHCVGLFVQFLFYCLRNCHRHGTYVEDCCHMPVIDLITSLATKVGLTNLASSESVSIPGALLNQRERQACKSLRQQVCSLQ